MDKKDILVLREFATIIGDMTMNLDIHERFPHLRTKVNVQLTRDRKKFQLLLPKVRKILGVK